MVERVLFLEENVVLTLQQPLHFHCETIHRRPRQHDRQGRGVLPVTVPDGDEEANNPNFARERVVTSKSKVNIVRSIKVNRCARLSARRSTVRVVGPARFNAYSELGQ